MSRWPIRPAIRRWMPIIFGIGTACAVGSVSLASSSSALVGIASENVGRGISYSQEEVALFGRIGWQNESLEFVGSAISVAGGADVELALAARIIGHLGKFEIRAGLERDFYPGAAPSIDYWEAGLTLRRAWRGGAVDLGLRASPDDSGGAQYAYIDLTQSVFQSTWGTTALRVRHGWRPYDETQLPDYRHWSVALEHSHGRWLYDLSYHDTDLAIAGYFPSGPRVVARFSYRLAWP